MAKTIVQQLVVTFGPRGVVETDVMAGLPPADGPLYDISTPLIPGVELTLGAGPDDLDETYLSTRMSRTNVDDHMDELLTSSSRTVETGPIPLSPISSQVQVQTLQATNGGTRTVVFQPVRYGWPVRYG